MFDRLDLPYFENYAISALCGGVGKTTLAHALAKVTDNLLVIDTCPQCDLSRLLDISSTLDTIYDLLLYSLIPGYPLPDLEKIYHKLVNCGGNSYAISSYSKVTQIPLYLDLALMAIESVDSYRSGANDAKNTIDKCLGFGIIKCMEKYGVTKSLIDTSSFFLGATKLAWNFSDALIIPVNGSQKSIQSLINMMAGIKYQQRIQLIVFTGHPTKKYRDSVNSIMEIKKIIENYLSRFTTKNPENHLVIFDQSKESARFISRSLWR